MITNFFSTSKNRQYYNNNGIFLEVTYKNDDIFNVLRNISFKVNTITMQNILAIVSQL